MSVLVTGGAGFIGSHAVLALLERGEKVVVLDDLSEGERERVQAAAIFVEGSILDRALVAKIIREHEVESVMHFAGLIKVEESMREKKRYEKVNVEGTRVLADVCDESGVKHFIFSGSASVYGNVEHNPIAEDAPLHPMSPYADTKMQGEKVLRATLTHATHTILRYFNVAGVDPSGRVGYSLKNKPTHLIRGAVRALLAGESFMIYGNDYPTPDGTCIRDFIHISDLVEAHLLALDALRKGEHGSIYNVGSERGFSCTEVVKALERVARRSLTLQYGPRRPGDPPAMVADTSRIRRELKWKPKKTLEDMLRDELTWVREKLEIK